MSITGKRLPTYKQVLLCLLSHLEKCRREDASRNEPLLRECSNIVLSEVLVHYRCAHVPTVSEKRMREKIEGLYSEYRSCMKVGTKARSTRDQVLKFQGNFDKTMPFWSKDVLEIMEMSKRGKSASEKQAIQEDIQFLLSMMSDRIAQYTCLDDSFNKRTEQREERKEREKQSCLKRKHEESIRREEERKTIGEKEMSEWLDGVAFDEPMAEPSPKVPHVRSVKTGTYVFISHDLLKHPTLVSTYMRNQVSTTAMASILRDIITIGGGDPTAVNLSYSSGYR